MFIKNLDVSFSIGSGCKFDPHWRSTGFLVVGPSCNQIGQVVEVPFNTFSQIGCHLIDSLVRTRMGDPGQTVGSGSLLNLNVDRMDRVGRWFNHLDPS